MDFIQGFLFSLVSLVSIFILLRLFDKYCPEFIINAISLLLIPIFVDVAVGIHNSITDALKSAEYSYPKYVYTEYCIHRTKKKFGLIPKSEHFVWNDNIEEEQTAKAFCFVMKEPV